MLRFAQSKLCLTRDSKCWICLSIVYLSLYCFIFVFTQYFFVNNDLGSLWFQSQPSLFLMYDDNARLLVAKAAACPVSRAHLVWMETCGIRVTAFRDCGRRVEWKCVNHQVSVHPHGNERCLCTAQDTERHSSCLFPRSYLSDSSQQPSFQSVFLLRMTCSPLFYVLHIAFQVPHLE